MKIKDILARGTGGISGAAVAFVAPHACCLFNFSAAMVGAGAGAGVSVAGTYAFSAVAIAGGTWYGLRRSGQGCCARDGETRAVRLKKAGAMAAASFMAVAAFNTLNNPGPGLAEGTRFMAQARDSGGSVVFARQTLLELCTQP